MKRFLLESSWFPTVLPSMNSDPLGIGFLFLLQRNL